MHEIINTLQRLIKTEIVQLGEIAGELMSEGEHTQQNIDVLLDSMVSSIKQPTTFFSLIDAFGMENWRGQGWRAIYYRGIPYSRYNSEIFVKHSNNPNLAPGDQWLTIHRDEYIAAKLIFSEAILDKAHSIRASMVVDGRFFEGVIEIEDADMAPNNEAFFTLLPFLQFIHYNELGTYYFTIDKVISNAEYFKQFREQVIQSQPQERSFLRYFYNKVARQMIQVTPLHDALMEEAFNNI